MVGKEIRTAENGESDMSKQTKDELIDEIIEDRIQIDQLKQRNIHLAAMLQAAVLHLESAIAEQSAEEIISNSKIVLQSMRLAI